MDYKYIEQLVERYFEAETTLNEEQILRAFYAQDHQDMPQELRRYAPLFSMLGQQDVLSDNFDEKILAMTEDTDRPATHVVKARTASLTEKLRPLLKAAAIVAVVLTLSNAINQSFQNDDTWVDTSEYAAIQPQTSEPAMAYDQNTDSLLSVADTLRLSAGRLE